MQRKPFNKDREASKVEFRHDRDLPYLEIRFSQYNACSFSKHTHDAFSMGLIEKGLSSFFCRGANHPIGEGQIAVIEPGELHACNPKTETGWTYKMFHIDADWMRQTAREVRGTGSGMPHFPEFIVDDDQLAQALFHIYRLVEHKADRLENECCMLSMISSFLERHASDGEKSTGLFHEPRAVGLLQEYFEDNLTENVSLKELSDLAGLYFLRNTIS